MDFVTSRLLDLDFLPLLSNKAVIIVTDRAEFSYGNI